MRRLSCTAFILVLLLIVVGATSAQEDPLACLNDRGDGSIVYEPDIKGRWQYRGSYGVPELEGKHGSWYGYDADGDGWSYSFGWPDDMVPSRYTVLFRTHDVVGYLWFYESPSMPELTVLFVYRTMIPSADEKGQHYGEHDFCWWGEVTDGYE